jgi:SPP1 family predicted phage head-tail adaptor
MQAGRLDRRITIEQVSRARNSEGIQEDTWSTFTTVWAGKDDRSARTQFSDQIEQGRVETVWRIRNLSGLNHTMRIVYDGVVYDIRGIREIGRGEGYIIGTVVEDA